MSTDYSYLLDEYPQEISLDQLYKICHFSKRKCRWLLEQGYIPCTDTGKKTRRFKIKMTDVVRFLTQLDSSSAKDIFPRKIFSSQYYLHYQPPAYKYIPASTIRKHLRSRWANEPNALEVRDIVELTGYSYKVICQWLIDGNLKYVTTQCGKVVAKKWLIEWLTTYTRKKGSRLSAQHRQIMLQLNQTMSPTS